MAEVDPAQRDESLGVSVVMGVYNAENDLPRTLESLAEQRPAPKEVIVVNDGSTDGTAALLERWKHADSSHRVLNQDHRGLTAALKAGCDIACGRYIARQDAGDVSLPGRLARQSRVLDQDKSVVMVSAGTKYVDTDGNLLYEVAMAGDDAMTGLAATRPGDITGPPHHGGVMFRRDTYQAVGGYRTAFYVAQDIDLWLRLVERGRHISLDELLYQANASPTAISFNRRSAQKRATALALRARACRQSGESEDRVLSEVWTTTRKPPRRRRTALAGYHFFVAGCLRRDQPEIACRHYLGALAANPVHWRAFLRWFQCRFAPSHRPPTGK